MSSRNLKCPYFLREKGPLLMNGKCEIHQIKLNMYFMAHSKVGKFEKIWLRGTLIIIRKPKKSLNLFKFEHNNVDH
jgi:hypothetical protein